MWGVNIGGGRASLWWLFCVSAPQSVQKHQKRSSSDLLCVPPLPVQPPHLLTDGAQTSRKTVWKLLVSLVVAVNAYCCGFGQNFSKNVSGVFGQKFEDHRWSSILQQLCGHYLWPLRPRHHSQQPWCHVNFDRVRPQLVRQQEVTFLLSSLCQDASVQCQLLVCALLYYLHSHQHLHLHVCLPRSCLQQLQEVPKGTCFLQGWCRTQHHPTFSTLSNPLTF